ncbi:unnamed protein product [Timema podura]|uniref:Ig-like domain-containing protein n=1 Tax=Timema podura TaxID=61482 RepID=A0ABN7NU37_TIMPD|nr:unnamed protein product [Timema podura]
MEEPSDTEVIIGNTCTLTCKTMDPTSNCLWIWRPSGAPQEEDRVIKEISPNGQSNDCSLLLNDVSEEQDGLWTCGARAKPYQNYTLTHSVKLTVVNTRRNWVVIPSFIIPPVFKSKCSPVQIHPLEIPPHYYSKSYLV